MSVIAKNHYFIRKLHSLLGIVPLGLFMAEHMISNSFALRGAEAYNQVIAFLQSMPFLLFLELGLIILPIAFHALYGLYIVYVAKNNVLQYSYYRNWAFYLQRITAVITFVYVIYHVWTLRVASLLTGMEVGFDTMTQVLSNPWILALYIVGVICAMYHFGNGIATFLITWGITVGPYSQKVATWIGLVVFVVLSAVGIQSLVAFI